MVWDLGKAMHKKEEFESSRLMDFEFRLRARAMRVLANRLGIDSAELAQRTVLQADEEILKDLASGNDLAVEDITLAWRESLALARKDLIAERGDPTPYRLG